MLRSKTWLRTTNWGVVNYWQTRISSVLDFLTRSQRKVTDFYGRASFHAVRWAMRLNWEHSAKVFSKCSMFFFIVVRGDARLRTGEPRQEWTQSS